MQTLFRHKGNSLFFIMAVIFAITIMPVEALASNNGDSLKLNEKYSAELEKCIDGNTAIFKIGEESFKTRFLYIDAPESTTRHDPYGKEAAEFTCSKLNEAKEIVLETDGDELYDKYNRLLAWIWVDGKLLQEELTKNGLVKMFYDYGDYKYEEQLHAAMEEAKQEKRGLYEKETNGFLRLMLFNGAVVLAVIIGVLIAKKIR